jgi:hypothetical protein
MMMLAGLGVNAQYQFVKQWDYRYGGNNQEFIYTSFLQTKDGGYLLGGISMSDVSGDKTQPNWDTNLSSTDFWIVRLDPEGHKLWDKRYGGGATEGLYALQQTTDGGFIMGGATYSWVSGDITGYARGDADYWVIKVDSIGNKQWDKRYGGNMRDELHSIVLTYDGGYILGGQSESGISGDKTEPLWNLGGWPYSDGWVVKIDSIGNKQWDKSYGCYMYDAIHCILPTSDGGYLLGANSNSGICGDKSEDCFDPSHTSEDYWVIKIDSVGNQQWDKIYGGIRTEDIGSILEESPGKYIVSGNSSSNTDGNRTLFKNIWAIKIDSIGNKISEFGSAAGAVYKSVVRTNDGGYLFTGEGVDGIELDPTTDRTELNLGKRQSWVIKLDSSGLKQWDKTIFSPGVDLEGKAQQTTDGCYAVVSFSNGQIGGYKTQAAYDSTLDYWILKFCMEPFSGIEQTPKSPKGDLNSRIQVWPNPFSTDVSIALTGSYTSTATFTITSITGQVVYQQQETNLATGYTKMLELSYLPNGVYFIEVSTAAGKAVQRVVKE